jgi:transposase InsO family protein
MRAARAGRRARRGRAAAGARGRRGRVSRAHRSPPARAAGPELRIAHGVRVSGKRVRRLMRQAGLSVLVRRKRGRTTIRVPGVRVADDLVERRFRPAAPNVLWVADVTYLRTWEGWLYLAAVQDAFSRAIVGWSMAEHMRAELVVDALEMALARRRPGRGLVHHSDRAASTSRSRSARPRATPASRSRWAPRATASTTPSPRASSPRSRRSSCTATAGRRGASSPARCSSTSRRSTTASDGTRPSATSRPPYENSTLGQPRAGLAASRLAHSPNKIEE